MRFPNRFVPPLCLLALFLGPAAAEENATDHFLKGRKLLEEGQYTSALEAFEKANALKPDLPEVHYGLGASLNGLGKYPEAKTNLEKAFQLLQNRPRTVGSNWGPIDIGYYAMLADIQVNLNEFEGAVATIGKYAVPGAAGTAAPSSETLNAVKKNIAGKIVAGGLKCLGAGDVDCARRAIVQSEKLQPMTSEALMAVAKTARSQAERVAGTTEEDKAKKVELFRMAVEYARKLPEADAKSPEARRLLAAALSGTKDPKDYQESIAILTSLWDASAGQPAPDHSILIDLTTGYLNGEEWDDAVKTATKYIQLAPEGSRSQGYCKRSFAYYRQGQYQSAIDDGAKCTNADGSPRQLRHVELAQQEIDRHKAAQAAASAQKQAVGMDCSQLNQEVQWARTVQNPELNDLVPIIAHLESGKVRCKAQLESADTSELCRSGVFNASNPANLSIAKPEDLKALEAMTSKFLKLCDPYLTDRQKTDVRDALKRITDRSASAHQ